MPHPIPAATHVFLVAVPIAVIVLVLVAFVLGGRHER